MSSPTDVEIEEKARIAIVKNFDGQESSIRDIVKDAGSQSIASVILNEDKKEAYVTFFDAKNAENFYNTEKRWRINNKEISVVAHPLWEEFGEEYLKKKPQGLKNAARKRRPKQQKRKGGKKAQAESNGAPVKELPNGAGVGKKPNKKTKRKKRVQQPLLQDDEIERSVYVSNQYLLLKNKDALNDFFKASGEIDRLVTPRGRFGRYYFGFVVFKDPKSADQACEALNGMEYEGRKVVVTKAKPPKAKAEDSEEGEKAQTPQ